MMIGWLLMDLMVVHEISPAIIGILPQEVGISNLPTNVDPEHSPFLKVVQPPTSPQLFFVFGHVCG